MRQVIAIAVLLAFVLSGCMGTIPPDTAPALPPFDPDSASPGEGGNESSDVDMPRSAKCTFTSARQANGEEREYRPLTKDDYDEGQGYTIHQEDYRPPDEWVIMDVQDQDWVRVTVHEWEEGVTSIKLKAWVDQHPSQYRQTMTVLEGDTSALLPPGSDEPVILEFRVEAIQSGEGGWRAYYKQYGQEYYCSILGYHINPPQDNDNSTEE